MQKEQKIIVTAYEPEEGLEYRKNNLIRVNSNKPEFGSLMLRTSVNTLNQGFLSKQDRVFFMTGTIEHLEQFVDENNLRPGTNFNVAMGQKHRIIVKERVTPFFEGQTPKIDPSTGEILLLDGNPIYRQTFLVEDVEDAEHDTRLVHDGRGDIAEDYEPAEQAETSRTLEQS
jgi:hypothetical protein